MSEKIYLAFCVHSHQPVGNFPAVFQQGSHDCYLPLLRILRDYPRIRMSLHYTGPLLEWFEDNEPEFFALLKELVDRSQVELVGGGFYEPILSVIPQEDAQAQIAYTKNYLEDSFGVTPKGLWCAERIWDPGIPKKVAGNGIDYTLLDDSHFLFAGLSAKDVHGYYVTEREGHSLKVFPIDMHLRYLIPFRQPHEVVEYLLELKHRGIHVITYGDDGEKFGMWPGTHKWVIEQGWLRHFFDEIAKYSDDIEIVPLSYVVDMFPANGLIYLPTAAYQEMMEWSLFAEQGRVYEDLVKQAQKRKEWTVYRGFLRGGMWDNFFAKYPESNLMHKKMLKVSDLVREYDGSGDAQRHLLMAQCNCAYWHGLFGGIYIASLRHAIYEHLLKAESIIDAQRFVDTSLALEVCDHDLDGRDEVLISGRRLNCYISPHMNASIFALEFKGSAYNFSNILMRHPEIYHKDIERGGPEHGDWEPQEPLSIHDIPHVVAAEYKDLLIYDTYRKNSFLTHYLDSAPSIETVLKTNRMDTSLTALTAFELTATAYQEDSLELTFKGVQHSIHIEKKYLYNPQGTITLAHAIRPARDDYWIALEWNLMTLSAEKPTVDGVLMEQDRGRYRAKNVAITDTDKGVTLNIESGSLWDVCIVPIECVSQSEEGFEKTFQGWSIYFMRKGELSIPEVLVRVE
ncbi:MAG TPA: DUF1926 domain-containing protein [Deltaproteobacteria bacterium]|nr:DUF1926 domain-containing protein [Deltaproteobacteria bacterium]